MMGDIEIGLIAGILIGFVIREVYEKYKKH